MLGFKASSGTYSLAQTSGTSQTEGEKSTSLASPSEPPKNQNITLIYTNNSLAGEGSGEKRAWVAWYGDY